MVVHAFFLGVGFVISYLNRDEGPGPHRRNCRDWLIAWFTELLVSLREFYWLMPFRESFQTPSPVPPRVPLPILFIHGDRDEFGSLERLKKLVDEVSNNADTELVVFENCGHFFDEHLNDLRETIRKWAEEKLTADKRR